MEDSFISILGSYIKSFSDFLWGWPLIILLVGTHIFGRYSTEVSVIVVAEHKGNTFELRVSH